MNMTGVTLKLLMRNAFRIQDFQIIGGPSWIESDRWDIQTKAEENASPAQVNEMLQTLLADRFQLKLHKETRELSVYELAIAKGGPKLQETRPDGPGVTVQMPAGRGAVAGSDAGFSPVAAGADGRLTIRHLRCRQSMPTVSFRPSQEMN